MCDVYFTMCKMCGTGLPVHLGDYSTDRDEVEVFCSEHLPNHDVRIFTLIEDDIEDNSIIYPKGFTMGIRYLTDNAKYHKNINHPNIGVAWEMKDRLL